MPKSGPVSKADLVVFLRKAGFEGPFAGGRHEFMRRAEDRRKVVLPNPHRGDISIGLLQRVLKQAGIPKKEWEAL